VLAWVGSYAKWIEVGYEFRRSRAVEAALGACGGGAVVATLDVGRGTVEVVL
jgi:hypothetical protein